MSDVISFILQGSQEGSEVYLFVCQVELTPNAKSVRSDCVHRKVEQICNLFVSFPISY